MQMIVRAGLARGDGGYSAHPGELAWWMYHPDPRYPDHITYWLQEDRGFLLLDSRNSEIGVFTLPGVDRWPLIDWAQTRRLDQSGDVGWVPDDDEAFVGELRSRGYRPIHVERSYRWDLENTPVPNPELPPGWSLRALQGEHEANSRREASHRAFESTMGDQAHLERYLKFMRSPAYSIQNDLVALTPTGRVASFMVWWPDGSGVAQIEPFGTHPEFQRQGVGRALLHFALRRMKDEGMRSARVFTDEKSEATTFYEGIGFTDVGAVRWWAKKS
jgi:ribosomal protein S18 acetylase RimI-like enzyme